MPADNSRPPARRQEHRPARRAEASLDLLISRREIHSVYQPVVTLAGLETIGFEALARGPSGSRWHEPATFLTAATARGRLPELDVICEAAAHKGALAAGLPAGTSLFINIEPARSRITNPADLDELIRQGHDQFQVVAEIAARAITDDPAGLLLTVDRLRRQSIRIAVDDVGADPASQALMSLLRPDVIKIDRSIIQNPDNTAAQAVITAVQTEALRGGAVIIAEGIETRQHLRFAQSIGATLGQGWLLGRPTTHPTRPTNSVEIFPHRSTAPATADTPFTTVANRHHPTNVSRETMTLLSRQLEDRAVHAAEPTLLLTSFQHDRRFDAATRHRYAHLSPLTVLAGAFGIDMPPSPATGVRGFPLDANDPLTTEWTVIVIGARTAEGLFARQLPTPDNTFEVITANDRDLVLSAARPLLDHMTPDHNAGTG